MLIAPAGALLLLGLYAGLVLIGMPLPVFADRLAELHAPLLVFGFVGTLISLERAVALRRAWAYAAPVLLAVGALLALSPAPPLRGGRWCCSGCWPTSRSTSRSGAANP
ncbi:hypothetical protein GCM10025869_31610 [Homoserinibacter gongjuensis]|uniref:Uncharacterized protein n=1 Tax=Homoserinibacter gongjuensis TaxID=1162968 RepID=A0ABQ6JY92_9MICO|nr:hypothetical protein GCM10025869_31610 [Homoserinibacter gongjuensis]